MIDRLTNIFLLFFLIIGFVLFADTPTQERILWAIVAGGVFGALSFFLNWLTLDGATSAWLLGAITFGVAGVEGAVILIFFFISSSLLSKNSLHANTQRELKFRRTGAQVWANGFWFGLFLLLEMFTGSQMMHIAAMASIAFATSDTWASEVGGQHIQGTTWSLKTFSKVSPGTDGAISIAGSFFALIGAASIGAWVLLFNGDSTTSQAIIPAVLVGSTGFMGCFIDSWLGAHIQGRRIELRSSRFFSFHFLYVGNNTVNWLAAGSTSIISILIYLIIQL